MDKLKKNSFLSLFPLIIFLSGFSALVYQIVWIREFSLLFGTHLLSTSTVLTVFMAGLSVGALFFGRQADRTSRPVWLLFIIQAGLACFAFLFKPLFHLITGLYVEINQSGAWLSYHSNLSRFILSVLLLILPSTLMGGTLPVMVKLYTDNFARLGNKIGSLYSLNNTGAFAGGLMAGFFLIRLLGSHQTNLIAASVNTVNALLILSFAPFLTRTKTSAEGLVKAPVGADAGISRKILGTVLIVTAIEGFTMLVYEILWTRTILEFSYDKSSYVYTVVILGFLFGLSAGAFLTRKRIDTWKNLLLKFSIVEYAAGLAALTSFILFSVFSPLLFNARISNDTWFHVSGREYILFFVATALPALLMGISYPLAGKIITDNPGNLGSRMGLLSFTDTIGSVAGPVVAGFYMLRFLDIYQSFLICVLLNVLSAIVLIMINRNIAVSLRRLLLVSGVILFGVAMILFPRKSYYEYKAGFYPEEQILAMKEGMTATVVVSKLPSKYLALSINGAKTAFTNGEDQRVHKMLAYLPWFFNPNAQNAAVIGFGLGITTRCLTELNIHTDLAELSPEVLQLSSAQFGYLNHGVLGSSYLKLYVEDGRSVLQRSLKKYDLITTNAVHPRLGPNLYSSDFYRLCSNRLTDSGTICQWIPTNWMSEDEFKSLIRSFTDEFPNALLWYANRAHTLIVGSKSRLDVNYEQFQTLFYRKDIYYELIDVDLNEPESVIAGFFMTGPELRSWASTAKPDTDDKPVIEYSFVTDPRPNRKILSKLVEHKTDFSKLITFTDSISAEKKRYILEKTNADYAAHISYLRTLNMNLAAEDSLGK